MFLYVHNIYMYIYIYIYIYVAIASSSLAIAGRGRQDRDAPRKVGEGCQAGHDSAIWRRRSVYLLLVRNLVRPLIESHFSTTAGICSYQQPTCIYVDLSAACPHLSEADVQLICTLCNLSAAICSYMQPVYTCLD